MYPQESTTSAGPAKAPNSVSWFSFKPPLNVVNTAKAAPAAPGGTGAVTHPLPQLVVSMNVTLVTRLIRPMYNGALGSTLTKKLDGSKVNFKGVPAAVGGWRLGGGIGEAKVSLGKMVMGSCCGQLTMNICARLYAKTEVKAVSKAVGKGEAPTPARR